MPLALKKRHPSPNWYIRGTDNKGRPVFESTGTPNRKVAEELLTKTNARLLIEKVHGTEAVVTFREAAAAYVTSGGQKTYLWRDRADGTSVGLVPHFGPDKRLVDITQKDLEAAAAAICPGAARETLIRNVYTPFIAVWNYSCSAGRGWAQPRKWERPRKQKGTAHRFEVTRSGTTPVSYGRAWQFVSAMSPAPAMVMTTLFYTGMRPIELFALECDDIDIKGRWIVVRSSKTGPGRGVPMHDVLVPLLTALKDRGGWVDGKQVFLTRHGANYPLTDDWTKGQLAGAIKGARGRLADKGVPITDVSPYTARHTVSTQLVMEGVHPHVKDQILGHAADDMSRHYVNLPQKPLIEAINRLPVIDAWREAEWLNDPITWQSKLLRWENYGRAGKPKTSQEQKAA